MYTRLRNFYLRREAETVNTQRRSNVDVDVAATTT